MVVMGPSVWSKGWSKSGSKRGWSAGGRCTLELHRDLPDGVVLAQRMPLPRLGHEDAGHVGMAVEGDAEHVEHLALGVLDPGMVWPQRRAGRVGLRHLHPQAKARAVTVAEEVGHDLEALG